MQTFKEIQQLSVETLTTMAKHTQNRQSSLCYSLMAEGRKAFALGDKGMAVRYLERSKQAYLRAQEDEHGQVLHVRKTAEAIGAKTLEEAKAFSSHYHLTETHYVNGRTRGEKAVR